MISATKSQRADLLLRAYLRDLNEENALNLRLKNSTSLVGQQCGVGMFHRSGMSEQIGWLVDWLGLRAGEEAGSVRTTHGASSADSMSRGP